MNIGIVGCGRFGFSLLSFLAAKGIDVLVLDKNREVVQRVSALTARAVQGDAAEDGVLKEAGFSECNAVVIAIGANMEGSILAAMALKEMQIPLIIAKAVTELHGKVLEHVGVNRVLYPDKDMAAKVARILLTPSILDYVEVSDGAGVIEIAAPKKLNGKTLAELNIRKLHGVIVLAIEKRNTITGKKTIWVPDADDMIETNDIMVVFGPESKLKQFEKSLSD